jgi:hypothetical protein
VADLAVTGWDHGLHHGHFRSFRAFSGLLVEYPVLPLALVGRSRDMPFARAVVRRVARSCANLFVVEPLSIRKNGRYWNVWSTCELAFGNNCCFDINPDA